MREWVEFEVMWVGPEMALSKGHQVEKSTNYTPASGNPGRGSSNRGGL